MKLFVNGSELEVMDSHNIEELVAELRLPASLLLIEHNGAPLRREDWAGTPLATDDRIELLRISAGG